MKALLFLCLVLRAAAAPGDPAADQIEQLASALKAEMKAVRETGESGSPDPQSIQIQNLLSRLKRGGREESGAPAELLQALDSLAGAAKSEKIEQICRALAKQLREELETKEQAQAAQIEKTFTDSLRETLAAKTAKDVDAPLQTLAKLMLDSGGQGTRTPAMRGLADQARVLSEFLKQWQDVLAARDAGNLQSARQKLSNLQSTGRDISRFMPRSEWLARLDEVQKATGVPPEVLAEQARQIWRKAKTLADLAPTLAELERFNSHRSAENVPLFAVISGLRSLHQTHEEVKKGLAANIGFPPFRSDADTEGEATLAALRSELLLLALPRVLGMPAPERAPAGENVLTFLQRTLASAREKEDWVLASRVFEAAQNLNLSAVGAPMDRAALQSFLAGKNQEGARQFALAVASYQAALRSGSQLVPAEKIGDYLEAIRKGHPQEFERGVQSALNAPPAGDDRVLGRRAAPAGSEFRPSGLVRPGAPETAPLLSVPAIKRDEPSKAAPAPDAAKPK